MALWIRLTAPIPLAVAVNRIPLVIALIYVSSLDGYVQV